MFSKLTSIMMIAALAVGGATANPASARDRSDNGNLIAGLAIGAIVGAAIASNSKSRRDDRNGYVARNYDADPYRDTRRYHGDDDREHRRHDRGHDYARPAALPGACRVYAGDRSGYSGRCLSRNYQSYSALPSACAVRVGGHHRTIYRDQCLNRYGFY